MLCASVMISLLICAAAGGSSVRCDFAGGTPDFVASALSVTGKVVWFTICSFFLL